VPIAPLAAQTGVGISDPSIMLTTVKPAFIGSAVLHVFCATDPKEVKSKVKSRVFFIFVKFWLFLYY
jgi:hypothetical protein